MQHSFTNNILHFFEPNDCLVNVRKASQRLDIIERNMATPQLQLNKEGRGVMKEP